MEEKDSLPIVAFPTEADFEKWLVKYQSSAGLWIKFGKKANPAPSITYAQALDVALCYGWIDGQTYRYDDDWYLQRFTPRRAKSNWSQINREHVSRLTKQGRMQPTGIAAVEAAKADGRWDAAYPSPKNLTIPEDLAAALAANPDAQAAFDSLKSTQRYSLLYPILTVKRPETRARKIRESVADLARRAHRQT